MGGACRKGKKRLVTHVKILIFRGFKEVMHFITCPGCTREPYPSRGQPVTKTSLPLKIPFTAKFCSSSKLLYPIYLQPSPSHVFHPSHTHHAPDDYDWAVTYRTPHDNLDVALPESWQSRCGMLTWVTRCSFSLPASSAHKERLTHNTNPQHPMQT